MAASPCILLVNAKARSGRVLFSAAQTSLASRRIDVKLARRFTQVPDLVRTLKENANEGTLCIVGGGDGTLSAATGSIMAADATLGVLPLGTGNSLARDLNVPLKVEDALDVALGGEEAMVDVGVANERAFLNVATTGLTTHIAEALTAPLKKRFGRVVYAYALYRAVQKLEPFRLVLTVDGSEITTEAVQLVVGNGRYHAGPCLIAPEASITSGKLHVYVVEAGARSELAKYALLLPFGLHTRLESVKSFEADSGRAETQPNQSFILDGEKIPPGPVAFHTLPRALRVRVPDRSKL